MPHDVFVSHSTKDKLAADAVVAHLERDGVRCWCAPRDIVPGTSWATSIMNAITSCKAMVVVFSHNANESDHIRREVERAISHGIPVVPVRIEEVMPEGDLEYFLSSAHWMDAITGSLERHLDNLAARIKSLLVTPGDARPDAIGTDAAEAADEPSDDAPPTQPLKRYWPIAAIVLVAIVGIAAFAFRKSFESPSNAISSLASIASLKPTAPDDGEVVVGPILQYAWDDAASAGMNTWYEIERSTESVESKVNRVVGRSFSESSLTGNIRWRVRTGHTKKGVEQVSPWTDWRAVVHYKDALEKIVATRSICIAVADEDETFVRIDHGIASGYEIDLLRRIFAAHLSKLGVNEPFTVNYVFVPWGDKLFASLDTPTIDLIGSGISITAEREKKYHIAFTAPIAEFPPAMLSLVNGSFDPKNLASARLGAAESTTDFALAQKIAATIPGVTATSFAGNDTNLQMVRGMVNGTIDAAIVDYPYAFALIDRYGAQNIRLRAVPVDASIFPDAPIEHVGFMTRPSDGTLRNVINAVAHDDRALMDAAMRHEHLQGVDLPAMK